MPSFTQLMSTGLQKLSPYVNNIADIFIIIFIMLALWALVSRQSRFAYIAPTLITSLSFVGVFLSFAIGLSVFNPNIDDSIVVLLTSLKAALMIGVSGYLSHFFIKSSYHQKAGRDKVSGNGGTPVTPAIIYSVLKKISDHNARQESILVNIVEQADQHQHDVQTLIQTQQVNLEQEAQLLTDIKRQLAADHVNTLTAQLYKLHNSLEHEFHQLQLMLTKGMGEVVETVQQLNQSLFNLEKTFQQHAQFAETAYPLTQALDVLQQNLQKTNTILNNIYQLSQKMGQTLPLLEPELNALLNTMQQQLQQSLNMMELSLETQLDMADTALENQFNGFTALQESFKILAEQTRESSQIFHREINTLLGNIHTYSNRFYHKLSALDQAIPLTSETLVESAQEQCYALMEAAQYQQAVNCFEQAIQFNPTEFSLFYNKACCHALQEQVELTVSTLQQAITLNLECLDMAKTDADFDKVRHHQSFQALLTHKPLSRGQSA